MKQLLHIVAAVSLLAAVNFSFPNARAQGTAFTYQGQLQNNGSPAAGLYDFRFKLFEDPLGNTQFGGSYLTNAIPVSNGLFIVSVDFGAGVFTGSNYWLEVDVRTNNTGSYADLSPLQAVTPAPYAVFANTASNLSGTISPGQLNGSLSFSQLPSAIVTNNETGVVLSGTILNAFITNSTFAGNGGGLTNLNGMQLAPYSRFNAFSLILGSPDATSVSGVQNIGVGDGTFVHTTSGAFNIAVGFSSLYENTIGSANTAVGNTTLQVNTTGNGNTAIGAQALFDNTSGQNNTACGVAALFDVYGGTNNIAVGFNAGMNLTGVESSNIDIGSPGSVGENNVIRIGTPGIQTQAYIAGVVNDVGGVSVGANGTQFNSIQSGQAIMPGSTTVETNFTIAFPTAFSSAPKIIYSLANDPGFQGVSDVFASNVSSNSPAAFSINVYRLNGTGWNQQLRVNWQAWQ